MKAKSKSFISIAIMVMIAMIIPKTTYANAGILRNEVKLKEVKKINVGSADINELYNERRELALDFSENFEKISEIDTELEKVGIEEISYEELLFKLNMSDTLIGDAIMPIWDVSSTKAETWTSIR